VGLLYRRDQDVVFLGWYLAVAFPQENPFSFKDLNRNIAVQIRGMDRKGCPCRKDKINDLEQGTFYPKNRRWL